MELGRVFLVILKENPGLDGAEHPLRVILTCYRVLRVCGDARATTILTDTHALLQERAAKISDENMRRSYLENVPEHRELVAEFAKRKDGKRRGNR